MTDDEKNLVEQFRRNVPGCFDRLYTLHGPGVYRLSRRLCRSEADAEDLTQEVFLAAFRGRERFAGSSSLKTWLYSITLFRWRAGRSSREPPVRLDGDSLYGAAPDPAVASVARIDLHSALMGLPEPLRDAFLLVKGEGLLCREAAEVLGIPEGTVKYHVHLAVFRLRSSLGEDDLPQKAFAGGHG